jgi:adenine-specific DNA-methyltransferase
MPVKYIPYYPNTVEGQAILDNITRTQRVLRYRENDKVYDRIKRGMPYYEVETIETVGKPSENLVIRGECISACAYLKEQGIKVDLVYIDPPFASGADYAKKVYIRKNPKLAEKIAAAEQQMDIEELKAFEEKMYGDIWQKEDYLNWMYENLMAIKSIMSEKSSIWVHLDFNIGHYVKVLMDEVFGEQNFLNEIIWHYENKPQFGFQNNFPRNFDTLFWYSIGEDTQTYNFELVPVKEVQHQAVVAWDPILKKRIAKRDENGNIIYEERTEKYLGSVWNIGMVHP